MSNRTDRNARRGVSRILRPAFLALALAAAVPALAHHSYSAFDTTVQKNVTGVVKKVEWTNPHIWIWLDVANEKGAVEAFGFEGMSPNYLARRGWEKNTLKPGDKVTVIFNPFKTPTDHGGMFISTKIGGKTLTMGGGTN
jgi:hypothetical protein